MTEVMGYDGDRPPDGEKPRWRTLRPGRDKLDALL